MVLHVGLCLIPSWPLSSSIWRWRSQPAHCLPKSAVIRSCIFPWIPPTLLISCYFFQKKKFEPKINNSIQSKSLLRVSVHYSEQSGCVKFVFSDLSAELSEEALCLLKLPSRLHSWINFAVEEGHGDLNQRILLWVVSAHMVTIGVHC